MTRRILFQVHWFLGITAGFVLALMGVTGAMMSFEDEIMTALSPGIVVVPAGGGPRLSLDRLIARASAQRGGRAVAALTISSAPDRAAEIVFAPMPGKKGRGEQSYADPRTGDLLGHARGAAFFAFVRALHRWLALPGGGDGVGRTITGFSAIALIFFALSGLYLRWPRRPLDWRNWIVLDLRRTGRNLYRALHAVIGGWMLLFYLLSATTGLWWSYDWYRQGVTYALTGKVAPDEGEAKAEPGKAGRGKGTKAANPEGNAAGKPVALGKAWSGFGAATGGRFERVRVTLPHGGKPAVFRSLRRDARHDRMTDDYWVDPKTGSVVRTDLYATRPLGRVVTTSMLELHRGAFFGLAGRIVMLLTSLAMPLFTVTGLLLYLARRRKKRELALVDMPVGPSEGTPELLVVHASQTGGAERLARLTASAFDGARIVPLARLDMDMLRAARRALFVVSTYGEGEPPDVARGFAARVMAGPAPAADLDYAVLALGDREYPEFCAFGRRVDKWLHAGGGRRLFDMIEVDGDDADAQRQWRQQVTTIGARCDVPEWQTVDYGRWRIAERRLLNPGSPGGPVFHVALEPLEGTTAEWEAGDIAEVAPRHDPARVAAWLVRAGLDGATTIDGERLADRLARSILPDPETAAGSDAAGAAVPLRPLPHREYSIASIPPDGQVHLLVRQTQAADGRPGIGSGWLTALAPVGGEIAMRLRANPNFRAPAENDRPMILIGNGTGLAGLRSHLRQRAAAGIGGNWLLLGERSRTADAFHGAELEDMLRTRILERLDRTWSRDADDGRYVQQVVAANAAELLKRVDRGAAIYVCGSLIGMAPAVDKALRDAIGDDRIEGLIADGRYRRDIY